MWGHPMGWDGWWGGGGVFALGHLLWLALLVVALVVFVRWLTKDPRHPSVPREDRAMEILRERYARGEIDKAEFDARKRDLS
jgi:putative membrane protein